MLVLSSLGAEQKPRQLSVIDQYKQFIVRMCVPLVHNPEAFDPILVYHTPPDQRPLHGISDQVRTELATLLRTTCMPSVTEDDYIPGKHTMAIACDRIGLTEGLAAEIALKDIECAFINYIFVGTDLKGGVLPSINTALIDSAAQLEAEIEYISNALVCAFTSKIKLSVVLDLCKQLSTEHGVIFPMIAADIAKICIRTRYSHFPSMYDDPVLSVLDLESEK